MRRNERKKCSKTYGCNPQTSGFNGSKCRQDNG